MATVFIPALLRERAGGLRQVEVEGATVNAIIDALDSRFPGVRARLVGNGRLVAGIGVVVDGEVQPDGLRAAVTPASEVHFVPAVRGGSK
jgi:molybdopterin converting factor small subunit